MDFLLHSFVQMRKIFILKTFWFVDSAEHNGGWGNITTIFLFMNEFFFLLLKFMILCDEARQHEAKSTKKKLTQGLNTMKQLIPK